MPTYVGKDGRISLLSPSMDPEEPNPPTLDNPVGNVTAWRLTVQQEMYEVTSFGDQYRRFVPGLREWRAEIEASWDADDPSVQQDELWETLIQDDFGGTLAIGKQVQVNLYTDGETVGSRKVYYGAAYVEEARVEAPVDGRITALFRLRGSGHLRYTGSGA
ncbi:MAG: hypothetical protein KatS3mg115_1383 [Candidatus Poribacteria bacterium]|nr:MAG: hypothetical protein KatS3mg115_1383 [Candidatus Poribacteria bacterium]